MPAEIEILNPGLYSSIQDSGRRGFRKFGVPVSGAMDSYASGLANLLLQNAPEAAVMEVTQQGPKIRFLDPTEIVITGADLSPRLNDLLIENNRVYFVKPTHILSFGGRKSGCRAYIGVKEGFVTEKILKSRSFYSGLTSYERLEKGMKLPIASNTGTAGRKGVSVNPEEYMSSSEIGVYPGPEYEELTSEEKKELQKCHFSIGRNNDRMAIQMAEEFQNCLKPILTGPVLPGTVQLTPSGRLIVLMRDSQTTGGYPRVLQLSERGINILAQKVMGEKIKFVLLEKSKVPST
jgi:biotin-dependent carboxylase-like uncharacterized protein